MTQTIEFNPGDHLPPEQVMKLPLIAKNKGFDSVDALLAFLLKRDLFPTTSSPTRKARRAAK